MTTIHSTHERSRTASPTSAGPERSYLELRVRRPASVWPVLRLVSLVSSFALCALLVAQPALGLFVFWSLFVPLLPVVFLLAPGLWRNLCPMAAANQVPRVAGFTRALALPRWLERHGYAVACLLFFGLVATRKLGLDQSGVASAALVGGAIGVAFVGGTIFRGKSAFCGGICPLRASQGLFGQAPVLPVATSHCRPCVGCTPNCTDLKPRTAYLDDLEGADPRVGAYRRLFAGTLPGFVLGFYLLPSAGAVAAPVVLGQLAAFSLGSLGAFFLLDQLLSRSKPGGLPTAFGAIALATFYWFNVPVLADALARLLGASAPGWVIWEGRAVVLALALGWLVTTLRRQRRSARAAPSPGLTLPLAPTVTRPRGEPAATPSAVAAPEAAVPGRRSHPAGVRLDPRPAAAARPTAGDPPVPVPDHRAPTGANRRTGERENGDRRVRRFEVGVEPDGTILEAAPGASLLEVCHAGGLPIELGCRMGICGNDPVYVLEGAANLSPVGHDEQATLERLGLPANARMACAARLQGDVMISFEARVAAPTPPAERARAAARPPRARPEKTVGRPAAAAVAPDPSIGRVVILGNGIAGVTAADHVRRHHPDCEIDLVTEESHAFYNRTSVSRLVYSREGMSRMYLLPPSWYTDRRITPWLNTRAASVDRARRHVVLGTGEELSYDRLILATGARARIPAIEGFDLQGSFALRSADDAMSLRSYIQRHRARRAVIVGGGVLGLEAADAARALGLEATIVELANRLAPVQLDQRAAALLQDVVDSRGIEVLLGRSVEAVVGDGERVSGVTLDDGEHRPADVVIACAGIAPNADLARDAGLEVGRGVLVDDRLRTSDEAIYAAGDVAEHTGHVYGHWPAAVEQAEAAAVNAIGGRRRYKGSLLATHLKVTGIELTSIGRPHAERDDVEVALEEEGGRYRKLVLSEGRIAGAILLGHPGEAGVVFAAAREGRDLGHNLERLELGDWGAMADPPAVSSMAEPRPGESRNGGPDAGSSNGPNGHGAVNGNGNGNGRGAPIEEGTRGAATDASHSSA